METNTETLSSVLAKLVTNPSYVEKNIHNVSTLLADFDISSHDNALLKDFFREYGKQFLASTRLLKKRRWDNIKQSLQLLTLVLSSEKLNTLWEAYTQNIGLQDEVPKNPLIESTRFCEYLLAHGSLTAIENALITYELIRNQTIVNFSMDFTDYAAEKSFKAIHPCYVVKSFECNISALVKATNQGQKSEHLSSIYQPIPETILFYKNWKKDGVASLKINPYVEQFIASYASLTQILRDCGVIHERGAV